MGPTIKERSSADLKLSIVHTLEATFDPYDVKDKDKYHDFINAFTALAYLETERSFDVDTYDREALRSIVIENLMVYADSIDHYNFEDNFEDLDAAREAFNDALNSSEETLGMLNSIVEDYNEIYGDLPELEQANVNIATAYLHQDKIPEKVDFEDTNEASNDKEYGDD